MVEEEGIKVGDMPKSASGPGSCGQEGLGGKTPGMPQANVHFWSQFPFRR